MKKTAFSLFLCLLLAAFVSAQDNRSSRNDYVLERIEDAGSTDAVILDLSSLGLTELPNEIASLDSVRFLLLGENDFTSFPMVISQMTNLEILDLSHNELTGLPPEIGNLSNLQQLHLSANSLSSIPPEIGNLNALTSLSLDFNQLSSLPPEITRLSGLVSLYVNSNQLRELPDGFGNLRNLCNLDVSNNQLTKVRSDILALPSLSGEGCQLYVMGNPFETGVQVPPTSVPMIVTVVQTGGQMLPTPAPTSSPEPAYTDIRPTLTPAQVIVTVISLVTASPEMIVAPSEEATIAYSLGDAPMEGVSDASWQNERLLIAGMALLGLMVSFFLGLRVRRDSRKRKPKL